MKILVLNAGSSSQKSCLYELEGDRLPACPPHPNWEATIDWSQKPGVAVMQVKTASSTLTTELPAQERQQAVVQMLETL